MIKVSELVLTLRVMMNMDYDKTQESAIELVDSCFYNSNANIHSLNKFKNYVVSNVTPHKAAYKEGERILFRIRTVDESLLTMFQENLKIRETCKLLVLDIECKSLKKRPIFKLKSTTPVVIRCDEVKGYWREAEDDEIFERNVIGNLVNKYYLFTKQEKTSRINFNDVFSGYSEDWRYCPTKFKDITLLGDKVTLDVNDSDFANELSYFALGVGIGTKNTRGFGFLDAYYK